MSLFVQFLLGCLFTFLIGYKLGQDNKVKDDEDMKQEEKFKDDVRTKNEIIAFVEQSIHRGGGTPIPQEQEDKWIAWLEKQMP